MIIRKMRGVVLVVLIAAASAQGGTFTMSFSQHATRNLFQTRDAVSDRISTFSLAFEKDVSALSLLADVEYSAFYQTEGLDFLAADIGLDYLVPAGGKSAFYFAASGSGAFYSEYYSGFSTVGAGLTGAFKTYLAPSSILKLQWQGTYASYGDKLFDHMSQAVMLSIDKYFRTRTTLKADAEYGYKYFLHPFEPEATGTILLGVKGEAAGYGGVGQAAGPGSGSGWGEHHYEGGSGFIPRTGEGGAGIGHVSASLLAAQGIGSFIGLSASAMKQWIVSGENPFMSIEEFYLVPNPSSDSFSWEGGQLTGRITLSLPGDIEIKSGYTYSDRTYPGVDSLDADGLPTGVVRNDVRHLFEARLEKIFRRVTVFVAYSHIDNASTDPLFDWSSGYVMGGFQWSLPVGRRGGR